MNDAGMRAAALDPREFSPLPGFEHIGRFWDMRQQSLAAKLLPGEYYVTRRDEMITTVLGSCVSACVRDPVARVGAMNHFMLPVHVAGSSGSWDASDPGAATRYGNYAMEHMLNDMMKAGARRDRMEVKLFGGGRVLQLDIDISDKNVAFALDYIATEGLHLVSHDVGGPYPRKVNFFASTGKVLVKRLTRMHLRSVAEREQQYIRTIEKQPAAGEIEFF